MAELSYQMIRSANQAREAEDIRSETRKKNLLVLVMHYLTEEGYVESASALGRETNLDFSKYEICDNVDLETIMLEYESFHFIKFQKYPKISKVANVVQEKKTRLNPNKNSSNNLKALSNPTAQQTSTALPKINYTSQSSVGSNGSCRPSSGPGGQQNPKKQQKVGSSDSSSRGNKELIQPFVPNGTLSQGNPTSSATSNGIMAAPVVQQAFEDENTGLSGLVIRGQPDASPGHGQKPKRKAGPIIDYRAMLNAETRLTIEDGQAQFHDPSDKLLKPLGSYMGYNQEWRELAMTISREIFLHNPNVKWDDIIGLESAKRLVKEAVVYPIKYPQLFSGILSPWKGLLLYGPPGTGKTLLAKAVATECQTTFFNISASSIVSKWRGDSEKLVRVLFEMARFHAPSTIFLDELDSLMSQRGGGPGGEHEGSRRMKTELLVQMDGLAKSDDLVFLLAASNIPWELDHAMLRRLEKRILVDLPTLEARKAMFMSDLPPSQGAGSMNLRCSIDYDVVADKTNGYSGSDITLVCKEAAMRVVRKIFTLLETHSHEDFHLDNIALDTLTTEDVLAALQTTKPSARNLAGRYLAWQKDYESC